MAQSKKKETAPDIIASYMQYVLEHGEQPKTIYAFAKSLHIKESVIYDEYGSFEAIEKSVFKAFFDHSKALLDKNKEYQSFDAQNKLLSFYYTFFEVLKANRSYVVFALQGELKSLKPPMVLSHLKVAFKDFVKEIDIQTMDLKEERLEKLKDRSVTEMTWGQLLVILRFWLEDDSAGFEKTDIFIEKSITTSFALLDNKVLKSVIDLGKFWIKEKMVIN